ncbi:MAG: ankyrin repeat domain-containing protein [Bdellovibrionales bacterium]
MKKKSTQWRERDLDNKLMECILAPQPELSTIQDLVDRGADVNSTNSFGESVLMDALCSRGDDLPVSVVKLLIEIGADIHYRDEEGHSALSFACYAYRPDVVELLLNEGADPNVVSEDESLLDYVQFDAVNIARECARGAQGMPREERMRLEDQARRSEAIISLLVAAGAKHTDELMD